LLQGGLDHESLTVWRMYSDRRCH